MNLSKAFPLALAAFLFAAGCKQQATPDTPVTPDPADDETEIEFKAVKPMADYNQNADVPEGELAATLRVMTFNINTNFNDPAKSMDTPLVDVWGRRKEAQIHMIKDVLPDVIFMQEVIWNQVVYIWENTKDLYTFHTIEQKQGGNYFLGVMTKNGRVELVNKSTKWYSYSPDTPFIGFDGTTNCKAAALCELKDLLTNTTFYAIGCHFEPDGPLRANCAQLTAKWIDELASPGAPAFVCGDLNLTPDDEMLKPLYDVMKDAVDNAKYSDGRENCTYNRYGSTPYKNLDHIFYRNVTPVTYRVCNSATEWGYEFMSDHYPVFADIRF